MRGFAPVLSTAALHFLLKKWWLDHQTMNSINSGRLQRDFVKEYILRILNVNGHTESHEL